MVEGGDIVGNISKMKENVCSIQEDVKLEGASQVIVVCDLESLRTVFKDSLMDSGKRNGRHKEWMVCSLELSSVYSKNNFNFFHMLFRSPAEQKKRLFCFFVLCFFCVYRVIIIDKDIHKGRITDSYIGS